MNKSILPAIVVSGVSTGIGRATVLRWAGMGGRVFAGVRNKQDARAVAEAGGEAVTPLQMDVTDGDQVAAAADAVRNALGGAPLGGLVVNAGIAVVGPLETVSMQRLRRQMDVNFFGAIASVQAFLPMLRPAAGRIVLISSISGRMSLPFVGPYCASKFALEAAADALRVELRPAGMKVSLIEPGAIDTPIWRKNQDDLAAAEMELDDQTRAFYGPRLAAVRKLSTQSADGAIPVDKVVGRIVHALTAPRPKPRYLIGSGARWGLVLESLPTRLRDWLMAGHIDRVARG